VVEVADGEANRLLRLVEALDELDDVEEVHSNFDIPDAVMEAEAAA
jgi:transcriptional/translational regulatory protein YebC/TACO1